MNQSKNSSLRGEECKTALGGEEQSSQTSSWWPLALIALCTVTTILDKRKSHRSTTRTEPQDKQTKRGQRECKGKDLKGTSLEHEDGQPSQEAEAIPQEDGEENIKVLEQPLVADVENRKPESSSEVVEKVQTEALLTGRARNYSYINFFVAACGFSIFAMEVCHMCASPAGSVERYGSGFAAFLSLAGFAMFLSRFFWMRRVSIYGYQVTDNPDDYALERTTFFAWSLLSIVLFIENVLSISLGDFGIKTVGGWIIALAFWTPIVSIVGSSWGKLKATNPNGDKAVWPCNWGKNRAGEVA